MLTPVPRKKVAIITGASAGLGVEFALQVERKLFLDEIWLIARRGNPMRELAGKFLKSKGVVLELDLTRKEDLEKIREKLQLENPELEILVNNAGYGKLGPFTELGLAEQIQMIELNVTALTYLTRVAIPHLKPGSAIIQVASAAAFSPSPYFAVYAATKAYVLSLSEALHVELEPHGIRVLAVCPGPVETEFFSVARQSERRKDEVLKNEVPYRVLRAGAPEVVEKALSDLAKNRSRSIFSLPIQGFCIAAGLLPRGLTMRALARRNLGK